MTATTQRRTKKHTNDERTVRCPVDAQTDHDCDATPLARGAHLHVLRSVGDGHGSQDEIPPEISLDDLETAGDREVSMNYPESRTTEKVMRLCPYCRLPFEGGTGVLIHLGQVAGKRNHPEDAPDKHDKSDFPIVHVDDDDNVLEIVEQGEVDMPSTVQRRDEAAEELADELRDRGEDDIAEQVEDLLT